MKAKANQPHALLRGSVFSKRELLPDNNARAIAYAGRIKSIMITDYFVISIDTLRPQNRIT